MSSPSSISRIHSYYRHLFPELFSGSLTLSTEAVSNQTQDLDEHLIARGWESQPKEFDYNCEVEGEIPDEIRGTFFRNGPGLLEVYGTPLLHPIDGDGMICAVRIKDGKAHFTSRYVETNEYKAEKTMKKALFRGMMGTMPPEGWQESLQDYLKVDGPLALKYKNPSNTNVYYWGGKLLACWESGLPYNLDPITLRTNGRDKLGGALNEANCLAAHFRYDPIKDLLVTFSVRLSLSGKTKVFIHEFDQNWNLLRQQRLAIDKFYYAHDFLLTDNYYIFHQTPFYNLSPEHVQEFVSLQKSPGQSMHYYPEVPSGMILIPRYPTKDNEFYFFECEPFHIYHHINAFEEGSKIVFNSVCLGKDFNMEFEKKFSLFNASAAPGRVYLFEIDTATNSMTWKLVDGCSCEFPTINIEETGKPWRYAYLMAADENKPLIPYQEVIKFDRNRSNRQVWSSRSEGGIIGEPVFIPKQDPQAEDDGWVIVQMYQCKEHHTQFVLLNASDLSSGPVARIHLKDHIPYGFHGTWSSRVY